MRTYQQDAEDIYTTFGVPDLEHVPTSVVRCPFFTAIHISIPAIATSLIVRQTNQGTSGVDETIIDRGVLAALQAPSSSARQERDKVNEMYVRADPELRFRCKNFGMRKMAVDVGFALV